MSLLESAVQLRNQTAKDMADHLKVELVFALVNIHKAQKHRMRAVDERCKEETFVEDLLLLYGSCLQWWFVGSSPGMEGPTHFP